MDEITRTLFVIETLVSLPHKNGDRKHWVTYSGSMDTIEQAEEKYEFLVKANPKQHIRLRKRTLTEETLLQTIRSKRGEYPCAPPAVLTVTPFNPASIMKRAQKRRKIAHETHHH